MPTTIKDIAKAANVSRGTVDRALNDRGGVNPDVAARIKTLASEMGYKPNTIAKALATRSNPIRIGVILNSLGNPFFDKVIEGINSAYDSLSDFGIIMEIRKMRGYDQEQQLYELEQLLKRGIDGLVITPIATKKVRDALNDMVKTGIQIVCCNLDIDDVAYQAYVGCDYFCSGQTAGGIIGMTTHGESNLGIITSSHALYFHEMRVKGCESVLSQFPNVHITDYIEAGDDEELSYNGVKTMLLENNNIDSLYFVTGGTTGGLRAIHDLHMEDRLRVFTFDQIPAVIDDLQSGLVIATIDQQPFTQGATSVRTLFESIMSKQMPTRKKIFTELNIKNRYNINTDSINTK